jgi:hypothetical protein
MATRPEDAERERLAQAAQGKADWRRFGPYLADRQWGTVREDYSANGDAWGSFPHEHARSRAYRWGEDGLLGICDDQGFLCLALWNEKDPILKERLFGVANPEGNHGEDVKECYYYLDATPTASYLKALYKYPQAAFPYEQLVSVNRARSKAEPEYELLDTGIFDGNGYFDVFVEYAKAAPDDILVRITAHNRGPALAPLHLLPTLWFRNTWSWKGGIEGDIPKPAIRLAGKAGVVAEHARLGRLNLVAAAALGTIDGPRWMFTENETNMQRLYGQPNPSPYVKDGFHAAVVERRADAVRPEGGTKCAAHFRADVPAGGSVELRLRLSPRASSPAAALREGFDEVLGARRREADAFYAGHACPEDAATLRQASAGMIWSKQFYYYVVRDWLDGDPIFPPPAERKHGRNERWRHLYARDIVSMPDKWEFPWFAAWDLAFHTFPFVFLDPDYARDQLQLMLRKRDPVDVPRPPRASRRAGSRGAALRGALPPGRVGQLDVRRELQLARTGLDAAQRALHPGALRLPPVLRRRADGGVPDRIRSAYEPAPGRIGAPDPAARALPGRRVRAAPLPRRRAAVRGGSELEGPHPLQRVLPRRHGARLRREPPDRVDGARGGARPPPRRRARRPCAMTSGLTGPSCTR